LTLLTPGVPQTSVKSLNFSSSITRLKPKSAIIISASSAFDLKSKFSGLRSAEVPETSDEDIIEYWIRIDHTAMNDPSIVDVLDGFEDRADEFCSVAIQKLC